MKRFLSSLCLLFIVANIGWAQTPFQNLDFEVFVPHPNSTADEIFGDLPGWGGIGAFTHAGFNSHLILDTNLASRNPLEGEYSITMAAGVQTDPLTGELVDPLTPEGIGISQTGLVPGNSRSIRLLATSPPGPWSLSLGGSQIALIETSFGEWAGDFSPSLAGTLQTLSIDMNYDFDRGIGDQPFVGFDSISFSSQSVSSVPEPRSTIMLVAGLLGLASRRRRKPAL